jgi:hypothetical protein
LGEAGGGWVGTGRGGGLAQPSNPIHTAAIIILVAIDFNMVVPRTPVGVNTFTEQA